jgi:hypothetical protein
MSSYRKTLAKIITFCGGIYFVAEFLLPEQVLEGIGVARYHDNISYGFIAVGAVSFGLGLINLGMNHGSRVVFLRRDWVYSAALLLGLITMMTVSLMDWFSSLSISSRVKEITILGEFAARIRADEEIKQQGVPALNVRLDALIRSTEKIEAELFAPGGGEIAAQIGESKQRAFQAALKAVKLAQQQGTFSQEVQQQFSDAAQDLGSSVLALTQERHAQGWIKRLYDLLFQGLFTALGSAMFSLLAIYIAAAAYRAFSVRSFESFLMMSAAVLVILGQTSFGLYISDSFPSIRLWLLEVPNSAAFRAIKIGAGVAGLIMAFRMWFSIESETFSRRRST